MKKVTFKYDSECQVMIKISKGEMPMIIERNNLIWRKLGPQDEEYARAVYLGQGCWERLGIITETEAGCILKEWGYVE